MRLIKLLIVMLLLSSFTFGKSYSERYFDSEYSQVCLGRGIHIAGTTVQYGGLLISVELLDSADDSQVPVFVFTTGVSAKISAGIISGRAASRAVGNFNEIYGRKHRFIWDYYIVACGFYTFSFASQLFLNRNENNIDKSLIPLFTLITSEIFFSIHSIKSLRKTRELADYVDEHERRVTLGISPILNERGGAGVAFAIQF